MASSDREGQVATTEGPFGGLMLQRHVIGVVQRHVIGMLQRHRHRKGHRWAKDRAEGSVERKCG